MTDLPNVAPMLAPPSVLTDEQAREILIGLEPGWYTVRNLYPRYLAYAEREKIDPPASKIMLGMALARVTGASGKFAHGHSRVYGVTAELSAG